MVDLAALRGALRSSRLLVGAASVLAYVVAYVPLHTTIGPGVAALSAVPVGVIGAFFGLRAGLIAGALGLPLNTILLNLAGVPGWDAVLRAGGGPGSIVLVLIGAGLGHMNELRGALELSSREASLEHGRLLQHAADLRSLRGALQASNLLIRSTLSHAPVTLFAVDPMATFTFGGGRRVDEIGLVPGELTGRSALEVFAKYPAIRDTVAAALAGEERSGTVRAGSAALEVRCSPIRDGDGTLAGAAGIIVDVTERRQAVRALERQAGRDSLTGLPNRGPFLERIEQAIGAGPSGAATPFSLLLLDLDNLGTLKEALGHDVADAVLRAVAARVGRRLRQEDCLARLEPDELALLLPRTEHAAAAKTCEAVLQVTREPVVVDGGSFIVEVSIGIAVYPTDGANASSLLRAADAAVAAAKRSGFGYAPVIAH